MRLGNWLSMCVFVSTVVTACSGPNRDPRSLPSDEVTHAQVYAGNASALLTWQDPTTGCDHIVVTYAPGGETSMIIARNIGMLSLSELDNGTEYTFTIQTANTAGELSAGVQLTATPDGTKPAEVKGLKAKGSGNMAVLTWSDPATANLDHIKISYQIGTAPLTIPVAKGVGEYVALYLTAGIAYTFRVQTVSVTGVESVGVVVTIQAPTNLAYTLNPVVYVEGVMIVANQPTSGGGAVDSYSVTPSLPAGLSLDNTTGIISGTPLAITPQASYTVTATNTGGTTTVALDITVRDMYTLTISGNAGVAGALITYAGDAGGTTTADGTGAYSFAIDYNWSGTVTPSLDGYTFSPINRNYMNISADQPAQDYMATVMPLTTCRYNWYFSDNDIVFLKGDLVTVAVHCDAPVSSATVTSGDLGAVGFTLSADGTLKSNVPEGAIVGVTPYTIHLCNDYPSCVDVSSNITVNPLPSPGKVMFVTNANYNGNLGGITDAQGADYKCMHDMHTPQDGKIYKAMIVDGTNRVACTTANCGGGTSEQIDWVLKPSMNYVRRDGTTAINTTTANGIFDFDAGDLENSIIPANPEVWTGLNTDWTTYAGAKCSNWTSATGLTTVGVANETDYAAIDKYDQGCGWSDRLCCVEQPNYTLTYTAGDHGSISGTSPQTVNYGDSGTAVTAVPNENYQFASWSDGVLTETRTDTNVTADISVTANFVIIPSFMVVRVGDGSEALSSKSTAVFLEERFVNGTLVRTITMPTAASGSNKPLTLGGTTISEGNLSLSANESYVTLAGYAAAPGASSISTSSAPTYNRVVGRVDAAGNVDTSTLLGGTAFTSNNVRSATSDNGSAFWVSGAGSTSNGGVYYVGLGGATPAPTRILGSSSHLPNYANWCQIFSSQLYCSASDTSFYSVFTVGTGEPTALVTATPLPGMPTASGPHPYGFFFSSSSTLYVADDRTIANGGGIQKWTFDGTTWTLQPFVISGLTTTAGCRGLVGYVDASSHAVLIATTADASPNKIVTLTDTGLGSATATVISTAGTNTIYRGVALPPH